MKCLKYILLLITGVKCSINDHDFKFDASIFDPRLNFQWKLFKNSFNKIYKNNNEESLRRSIWETNLKMIEEHNNAAKYTFELGLNEFSDWTRDELENLFGTIGVTSGIVSMANQRVYRDVTDLNLPASIDWREVGFVSSVKNQGQCKSCWAFAAVATLEAQHFNKTGELIELSEKNLVDCTRTTKKCDPFMVSKAFDYIIRNNGIDTLSSYLYQPVEGDCQFKNEAVGSTMITYQEFSPISEDHILALIAEIGPIAVSINANCNNFKFYKSGIFDGSGCRSDITNHAVTIVGYESNSIVDYYIIKNSWGTTWGENGYMRLLRNKNALGITAYATYPIV